MSDRLFALFFVVCGPSLFWLLHVIGAWFLNYTTTMEWGGLALWMTGMMFFLIPAGLLSIALFAFGIFGLFGGFKS